MQKSVICLLITFFTHCLSDEINYQPFQKPSFSSEFLSHSPTPQPISYCDAYKHRNTHLHSQIDLNCYTANQLQHYFSIHHYSEEQILAQELLYLSDEFVKLVKKYPAYEQTIEKLYTKFKKFGAFKKVFYAFAGTYSSGLKRKIHQLYQEIQLKKERKQRQIDAQKIEYQDLRPIYAQYSPLLAKAIERRIHTDSLEQLQKIINLESMDIIEKTKSLPTYSILYPHQNALIDCATAMRDYNTEKCFDKAICIADFCWSLLDYGQAIMEGAALGLYATAQDLIEHPIEATISIVAGKQILTYQLCKVLYNIANVGLTAITDYNAAKEKWDNYLTPLSNLIAAIENKEITLRDSLKAGTAFVIGYKAQSKLLGGLGTFCKTIKQQVTRFAQNNISSFTIQKYLATPEGYLLRSVAKFSCSARCPNQYEHLKQWLRIKEFTSVIDTTKHGIERLIERGFTPKEVYETIHFASFVKIQHDKAFVYIKQIENKFHVIVLNKKTKKVATAIKNTDQKSLNDLGKNYGWRDFK